MGATPMCTLKKSDDEIKRHQMRHFIRVYIAKENKQKTCDLEIEPVWPLLL